VDARRVLPREWASPCSLVPWCLGGEPCSDWSQHEIGGSRCGSVAAGRYILVAALLIAGLAGSLLPLLPGTPLILAAALLHGLVTDFSPIGAGRLLMLAALAALAYVLDYVAGAVGAKKFGGSAWAVVGALVGAVVGLFFGPPGLLIGPVVGAVAGELLRAVKWNTASRRASARWSDGRRPPRALRPGLHHGWPLSVVAVARLIQAAEKAHLR